MKWLEQHCHGITNILMNPEHFKDWDSAGFLEYYLPASQWRDQFKIPFRMRDDKPARISYQRS